MSFFDGLYKLWASVWNNKQSWLGTAMAVITMLQANPDFQELMGPQAYKITMLVFSVLMIVFARSSAGGVISSVVPERISTVPPSQRIGSWLVIPFAGLLLAGMLSGCAGTKAAYQEAGSDPEELAFVVTSHYYSVLEEAAKLRESGSLAGEELTAARRANDLAEPVIESLGPLAQAFKQTGSAADRAALQAAVNDAVKKLADLLRILRVHNPQSAVYSSAEEALAWAH